jgi:hypothetical protein
VVATNAVRWFLLNMNFDYKKYQMRAANAATNEEKLAINQELKDLYASFSANEKKEFDLGLEEFLKKEKQRLEADYEAIKSVNLN